MFILNQTLSYKPYNAGPSFKAPKTVRQNTANRAFALPMSEFYGPRYCGINFTGAKLKVQMQRLKANEFPSDYFYNYAIRVLNEDPDTEKTIFDVHSEFYGKLFSAKTLEEAKAYYPELEDVIDAKDCVKMTDYEKMPYGIRKIYDGEVREITIEDLTLDLLKKVYGGLRDRKNPAAYYGFADRTIDKMLEALNIKKFPEHYSKAYRSCNPDNISTMSKSKKKYYEDPDNLIKHGEASKAMYEKHPELKQAASTRLKAQWAAMTPAEKAEYQKKLKDGMQTEEVKNKLSENSRRLWQDEDYLKKQRAYNAIKKMVWDRHPEIKAGMQKIAKEEFPLLGVFKKIPKNKRTPFQKRYVERYFARVNEIMPDAMKNIGKEIKEEMKKFREESGES